MDARLELRVKCERLHLSPAARKERFDHEKRYGPANEQWRH
jgi:hypothetical protein